MKKRKLERGGGGEREAEVPEKSFASCHVAYSTHDGSTNCSVTLHIDLLQKQSSIVINIHFETKVGKFLFSI
jgi:hypothetical protein